MVCGLGAGNLTDRFEFVVDPPRRTAAISGPQRSIMGHLSFPGSGNKLAVWFFPASHGLKVRRKEKGTFYFSVKVECPLFFLVTFDLSGTWHTSEGFALATRRFLVGRF